ncbi:MAG: hypothetical protein KUG82_21285 [Pseudomonadales bacterium]|nr:hypothetical protein [Pseudomonadales bacterium]
MTKIQITEDKIKKLGNKISARDKLEHEDQELLVSTFALAGEAINKRTTAGITTSTDLSRGLIDGFRGSVGPQIGGGGNPAALDVGVDINVNW